MVILVMLLLFNYVICCNYYAIPKAASDLKTLFETDLGAFQFPACLFWSQESCQKNYVVLMDMKPDRDVSILSLLDLIKGAHLIQLLPLFA